MRFNLISYLNPRKFSGGGEMIVKRLLESGTQRGHKFNFSSIKDRHENFDEKNSIDFVVDIFNYPHTLGSGGAWLRFSDTFLSRILERSKFINLNTAYSGVCNLAYLPCGGHSSNPCKHKVAKTFKSTIITKEIRNSCFATNPIQSQFFTNSLSNIYLSPLHKSICNQILGLNDDYKAIVMKPTIDTSAFKNFNIERDIEYLFVGVISEAKGYLEMKQRFAQSKLFLVGDIHPSIKLDFGIYLGKLPYEQIPMIMNRAKNFVFLPKWPEPQGRVVIEAALCGCNLITNDNVGAMSFPFRLNCSKAYLDSEEKFWNQIENILL